MGRNLKQNAERIENAALEVRKIAEAVGEVKASDRLGEYVPVLARGMVDGAIESSWSGSRQTAGGMAIKDGLAVMDKLKGKSLKVWQRLDHINRTYKDTLAVTKIATGAVRIRGNSANWTSYTDIWATPGGNVYTNHVDAGHIYFLRTAIIRGKNDCVQIFLANGNCWESLYSKVLKNDTAFLKAKATRDDAYMLLRVLSGYADIDLDVAYNFFDLTAMDMADVSTPDEFANRMGYASIADMPYIEYTAEPQILPFNATAIRSKGRNLVDYSTLRPGMLNSATGVIVPNISSSVSFDKEKVILNASQTWIGVYSDYIEAKPGMKLFFRWNRSPNAVIAYDANKVKIGDVFTHSSSGITPEGTVYVRCGYYFADAGEHEIPFFCLAEYNESLNDTYTPYMPPVETPLRLSDIKHNGQPLFPEGMRSAGSVYDELNQTKAIQRIGMRDGEPYVLPTPIEVPLPEDFHLPFYAVQNGGTEELLTEQPSAPIDAEIAYRYDYAALATSSAALLAYANEKTGNDYPDLGEVIRDLAK